MGVAGTLPPRCLFRFTPDLWMWPRPGRLLLLFDKNDRADVGAPVCPRRRKPIALRCLAIRQSGVSAALSITIWVLNYPPIVTMNQIDFSSSAHAHAAANAPACSHSSHQADGIYLISPSGFVADPGTLAQARDRLQAHGFKVETDGSALARFERFAGTDEQRVAAIQRAIRQPLPIVMATRGGYGLSRILPYIDWNAVAASGKRFVGHSDFTAFNLALLAKTGAVSYSGPSALHDFGTHNPDELTADLFVEVMRGELQVLSFEAPDADAVDARGVLWGGNLALVASLVGTPYMPDVQGGVLFLEDIAEHPYRVERMLTQLWHAGILERQSAIVLGHFTEYQLGSQDNGFDLPAVVRWLRATVRVPVVTGLPYGHVPTKATLPVGRKVGIATEEGMAYLLLDEHNHQHAHPHS